MNLNPRTILRPVKNRIRQVVFWIIWILVATGAVNVYFTGLYRPSILFGSSYGHRFLIKFGAVLLLFSVYFLAPYLTGQTDKPKDDDTPVTIFTLRTALLHVIAFTSGLVAAFLGLTL